MARKKGPVLEDNKILYFKEQLYRELSQLFEWENLPVTVPRDYLERNLVRHGYALFYYDENIGYDVLRCAVRGYNRHGLPIQAYTHTPNTDGEQTSITRNLKYLSQGENVEFNSNTDGVLIRNMEYGQSTKMIVEHFAERLALIQQAFDTNIVWANIPYIFQTNSDDTRLSIEKMFQEIFEGNPFVIVDKELLISNENRAGVPTGINFIAKDLMDIRNEVMMKFRETVGYDTTGIEKAERVNTMEISSNKQHTRSVMDIMLEQRQIAVENINNFFGLDVKVDIKGKEFFDEEGDNDGAGNNRIEESLKD